jgi:hypothetical protein
VQNAGGAQLLNIDNTTNNIITNGGFEVIDNGWSTKGSASITRSTAYRYYGNASEQVTTTASISDGLKYNLTTSTLASATKYTLSFYFKQSADTYGAFPTAGRSDDGSTDTNCTLDQPNTYNNSWSYFYCTFTTGTTSGTPYIYIKQSDATASKFYVDAVRLTRFSELANASVESTLGAGNWQAKGTPTTHAQSSAAAYDSSNSLHIVTQATANQGTKQNITLTPSTYYYLSFWAQLDSTSAAFSTLEAGYSSDGTNDDTVCISAQTAYIDSWTKYTCRIFTPASYSGTPYFYIKQTNAAVHDFYLDYIQLTKGNPSDSYSEGAIQLNGIITTPLTLQNTSNSTNAFSVQGASGNQLLNVDSQNIQLVFNRDNNGDLAQWRGSTTMPGSRQGGEVVAAGSYLYWLGGENSSTVTNDVYYTLAGASGNVPTWQSATSLPANLEYFGAVYAQGYIFVMGGRDNSLTAQSAVYRAKVNGDGTLGSWIGVTALPGASYSVRSFYANGYLYAIGANGLTANYYARVGADGSLGAWTSTNAPGTIDSSFALAAGGGYVYTLGGYSSGSLNSVSYAAINSDGSLSSWFGTTDLPVNSNNGTAIMANGYVYFIGGYNTQSSSILDTVYYAAVNDDGSLGSWNKSANRLPDSRTDAGAASINGWIYVIGGAGNTCGSSCDTTYYASTPRILAAASLDLVGLGLNNNIQNAASAAGGGSLGGSLTAGNTQIVGMLQVQGQAYFAQSVVVNGNSIQNGNLLIGSQTDNTSHTFASTCNCLLNSAAGTFVPSTDTGIDGAFSSAVYNGKLYVGTKESNAAAVYRYDGGTSWTRVSYTTLGRIVSGDATDIDQVVLSVWNNKLYAGASTGANTGAVYSYNGSTWTMVNSARGTFGGETNVDGVSDMTVWNGKLYVASQETDLAGFYRYDGGSTLTRVNFVAGKAVTGDTASIDKGYLVAYQDRLWWGVTTSTTTTTGLARLYMWDGTAAGTVTTTNMVQVNSTGGQFISAVTGIEDVTSLAVWNGQLFVGTADLTANLANIYVYTGGGNGIAGTTNFVRTTATSGRIDATNDATDVDSVPVMRTYNGRLYAGSATGTTTGALYEYDGVSAWTKVNTTRGRFGGQTTVQQVDSLVVYNSSLYVGTETSNIGSMYVWTKTSGNSYTLSFSADSTGSSAGTIGFVAGTQIDSASKGSGSFVFSNGILTTSGSYDIAEDYPTRDNDLKPGDLVSIDTNEVGFVKRTSAKNESTILGVYSEKPGLRLSQSDQTNIDGADVVPVALSGRVPVKVTDENGPVMPGDYLTSSSTPGYAMKATSAGPTLGKALEPLDGSTGKVLAFVNVSYYLPTVSLQGSDYIFMNYLQVSGLARIESLEVAGIAKFNGAIVLGSHIIGNSDTAGTITIPSGQISASYIFNNPFDNPPKVTVSANADTDGIRFWTTKTNSGFTLHVSSAPPNDIDFDYLIQGSQ